MVKQMTYRHGKGFSLIELLVVVAILATLVSLLSPSLKRALGTAQSMQCAQNLKELGSGFVSYSDDHPKGFLPSNWTHRGGYDYWLWDAQVSPYLEGEPEQVFSRYEGTIYECASLENLEETTGSYGVNNLIFPNIWGAVAVVRDDRIPMMEIANPSQKLLVADTPNDKNKKVKTSFDLCGANPKKPEAHLPITNNDDIADDGDNNIRYRHVNQSATALYGDLHVEAALMGTLQVKHLLPKG